MADKDPRIKRWHRLDNTANLFPVITNRKFSNVYRISFNLSEPVVPELLQEALAKTLPRFSAFKVRLHRGFFWHYLEENTQTPLISEEDDTACLYIDPAVNHLFLFRLCYFNTRISLETYHVLSDGTGSFQFLRAIVCQYLLLAHPTHFSQADKAKFWFAQHSTDTEDSYVHNYTPTKKASFAIGRGYRIRGERSAPGELSILHAHIPVGDLLQLARSKNVSISHYITACIAFGLYEAQLKNKPSKYPVNIFIPVNLRNLFPSTTTLNFFSNIYVSLKFSEPVTFDDILLQVKKQYTEKASKESMMEKISYTVGSGYSPFIRAVPLFIKMIALRIIFERSAKSSTMGFSNLGVIDMPDIFTPYITGTSFLLNTISREPFKTTACSFGDIFTLSFTSSLRNMDIHRAILRKLSDDGLCVTVQSNGVDYDSL